MGAPRPARRVPAPRLHPGFRCTVPQSYSVGIDRECYARRSFRVIAMRVCCVRRVDWLRCIEYFLRLHKREGGLPARSGIQRHTATRWVYNGARRAVSYTRSGILRVTVRYILTTRGTDVRVSNVSVRPETRLASRTSRKGLTYRHSHVFEVGASHRVELGPPIFAQRDHMLLANEVGK